MKNQNSIYKLKKIKLQRLIPYYKQLKIDAVKRHDFENAAIYRANQLDCEKELSQLKIGL